MKHNLLGLLLNIVNAQDPSSTDYQIARYILTHVEEREHMTAARIAESCRVAKSSVTRFCHRLGMSSFAELHVGLENLLPQPDLKFLYRRPAEHEPSSGSEYLSALIGRLEYMRNHPDILHLSTLAEAIARTDDVAAFGHLQSGSAALALQNGLYLCGKLIYCTQDQRMQRQWLKTAGPASLLVGISASDQLFTRIGLRDTLRSRPAKEHPRIFEITASAPRRKLPEVTYITLADERDFATENLLAEAYVRMLTLAYWQRFGTQGA